MYQSPGKFDSPAKFDTPTKQHSKIDYRMRKSGYPVALKRSSQFHQLDCFMLTYFHIPSFAEQILQYDDSIINEEGVTVLLQKLFIQLIYCKKKDTSAFDVYTFMKDDYNTRYKSVEEFLVRFFEKVDDTISKYRTMLNNLVEEHPIRNLFLGKLIQGENETSFNLIKIELEEESLLEGLQQKYINQDIYIKELPKILQFEISKSQKLVLSPTLYLDEFLHSNKGTIKQHQADISILKQSREEIVSKIKNLENYQSTNHSVPQMLQMTIDLIQEQRNEMLDGDPAIEGLLQLIIEANQELSQLKEELKIMDEQIKLIMGNFNKVLYELQSVIIYDGDYECVYIKNQEQCFFFEDGYVEVKKRFDIEMTHSPNAIVYLIYTNTNLKSDYSFTGGQGNLLDMDDRKPYQELVRKDLVAYAAYFNNQVDSELYQYKQQQQAEEVFQHYLIRYDAIIQIVSKKYAFQVPILTNFATFLFFQARKPDDFFKWQILDCSIRDITGQSIQDMKNMSAFAQKLCILFQNQPQRGPSLLTVSKKEMQIMQLKLQDYVQQIQCTKVLIHSIQCILECKSVQALNSLRAIYEFNNKNTLVQMSQEILKAYLIGLGNDLFHLHQTQQYPQLWDNIQWIMTYWVYVFQNDYVYKQLFIMIKDIKKKANKKALNSDQLKIIKKFLTAVEEKKSYDIGTNILMRTDLTLDALLQVDWNQDNYYWILDNNEDITTQLINQIHLLQQQLKFEFQFVKNIMTQQQVYSYDERVKMQIHGPA